MVGGAAGVHEGLGHDREAGVHNVGLAQVEHKVRVLDQVHPKPVRTPNVTVITNFMNMQKHTTHKTLSDFYSCGFFEKKTSPLHAISSAYS